MNMELKLHQMNKTILSKQLLIECLDHYHNVKENDYVVDIMLCYKILQSFIK